MFLFLFIFNLKYLIEKKKRMRGCLLSSMLNTTVRIWNVLWTSISNLNFTRIETDPKLKWPMTKQYARATTFNIIFFFFYFKMIWKWLLNEKKKAKQNLNNFGKKWMATFSIFLVFKSISSQHSLSSHSHDIYFIYSKRENCFSILFLFFIFRNFFLDFDIEKKIYLKCRQPTQSTSHHIQTKTTLK